MNPRGMCEAIAGVVLGAVLYEVVTGGAELAVEAARRWRDRAQPLPARTLPHPAMLGQCGVPLYDGDGTNSHVHCTRPAGHDGGHR